MTCIEELRAIREKHGYSIFDHSIKALNRERLQTQTREKRIKFPTSTYSRLYQSQHGLCSICEMPMVKLAKYHTLEIDHRDPNRRDGFNDWDNLGLAHEKCNREKSSKSMQQMSKETGRTTVQMLDNSD
jgi:5-methylcytosine-specific restriction endonuclease McrA